jgi:muramoyltetrapeptide carboxypeptidase LdcA involved in peptidoglycan recycling
MNLMDAVLDQKDGLSEQTYEILSLRAGDSVTQNSSKKFQRHFRDFSENVGVSFNLTEDTEWKALGGESELRFTGRLMGGCLDTLRNLVGTPYGNLNDFASRFKNEGLILYLENSGSTPSEVCRSLWNMKLAGWFQSVNGVVLGRSSGPDATGAESFSYLDALRDVFEGCKFPVVFDADIGHLPPQLTILNGSYGELRFKDGAGSLKQSLV